MMEANQIIIHLFGAFRTFGKELVVETNGQGITVSDLKKQIAKMLNGQLSILAEDSVIASASRILGEEERVENQGTLSILPPVCGG